jgi:hypothetical protein
MIFKVNNRPQREAIKIFFDKVAAYERFQ